MRKLRILHVLVQPVLVWDEDDELSLAPAVEAKALPLSAVAGFMDQLPDEVALIQAQIEGPPIEHEPSSNGSHPPVPATT